MAAPDVVTWNEALPDNSTLAHLIDDFNRDLRSGVRARMAREHIWPTTQTGTAEAGHHQYISFQSISSASMVGVMTATTAGALYVGSSAAGYPLVYLNSAGTGITVANSAGHIPVISGGTQGSIAICSSASPTSLIRLTGSTDGLVLLTHAATAAPTWGQVAASAITSGVVTATHVTSLFGNWLDCSTSYANIEATADGFVVAYINGRDTKIYTDNASPPTTLRDGGYDFGAMCPVKKGHFWTVVFSGVSTPKSVYWIPLGV